MNDFSLTPYYLNSRRIADVSGIQIPLGSQSSIVKNSLERVQGMDFTAHVARQMLASGKIPNLAEIAAKRPLSDERLIAFVWGVFTFKGASAATDQEERGKPITLATFRGQIPLGDDIYSVEGPLYNEHYYSTSSTGVLSGKKRMLVAGHFQFEGDGDGHVAVSPYIIGEMIERTDFFDLSYSNSVRVYPFQVEAFKRIRDSPRPSKADLESVLKMPETTIKSAFAEIIGEPYIPKDWGGEKSDLQTSRLVVNEQPISAAFIFKGPSVKGEMHPSDMGKRGDQLVRAFDEPARLIVVQHCNKVANTVVRIAEALAYDPRNPRQYCIIDGADTAHILRTYGYLCS